MTLTSRGYTKCTVNYNRFFSQHYGLLPSSRYSGRRCFMAVAQHPRVAGERPVRAGGDRHVASADWWTGPAGWRVGVAPVSRAGVRLSLLLKELAKVFVVVG